MQGIYCSARIQYSCRFPDSQVSFVLVASDRYLDYFTTIREDRLWQVLIMIKCLDYYCEIHKKRTPNKDCGLPLGDL